MRALVWLRNYSAMIFLIVLVGGALFLPPRGSRQAAEPAATEQPKGDDAARAG